MGEKVEINLVKYVENGMKKRMSLSAKRLSLFQFMDRPKVEARLVNKDGSYHVEHIVDGSNALLKRFRTSFQSLLQIKWRWIIVGSAICFPATWILFAALYYAVAFANGDTVPAGNGTDSEPHQLCVENANDFAKLIMFSVETQTTVGYGFRYPHAECPVVIVLECIQLVFGTILQGCLCGIIWARLIRPKRRGQEVVFSANAVINQNSTGNLCLVIRISDIAGNHLNNLSVRLFFVEKKKMWNTEEEMFAFRLLHMNVGQDDGSNSMLLLWPSLVTHVIDEHSPLYGYSKLDLERADFEIIAVVEGSVEATGLTVQTRTSYLPHEILWGRKFQPMNFIGRHQSKVKVHYREFDSTCYVETPTVAAKKVAELYKGRGSIS